MQPLELDLESAACRLARQHGWVTRKLKWVGRRSAMDRVFFGHGRCVFVEFKRRGAPRPKLQIREIERLAQRYREVYVCDTMEGFRMLMGITE